MGIGIAAADNDPKPAMEHPNAVDSGRAWRPWLTALGLWLALAAVSCVALWQMRREAIDSQGRELSLLSLASTDAIDRGLRGADEGLHALRAELLSGQLPLSGAEATQSLHTRAGLMPLVQTLWLLDSSAR